MCEYEYAFVIYNVYDSNSVNRLTLGTIQIHLTFVDFFHFYTNVFPKKSKLKKWIMLLLHCAKKFSSVDKSKVKEEWIPEITSLLNGDI